MTPASYLRIHNGTTRRVTYWNPVYRPDERANLRQLCEEFRELVRTCVDRYAHDVTVGCFLSGGTDSSTIAGHLGQATGSPARTFSIGFDASGYDEMQYARTAAASFGTSHHEYYVTPDDVLRAIPLVAAAYSEPFGNASAVPTYYCACLAREHGIERLLGGDGGDELFAGNRRYAFQKTLGYYGRIPPLFQRLLEFVAFSFSADTRIVPIRKTRSYIAQARMPMPRRLQSYNYFERDDPATILDPDYLRLIDVEEPRSLQADVYDSAQADTMLDRMLALDLKVTLADDDLPKVSRMCHAAGVGVEYPFLCEEMVTFACKVPAELKLRGLKLRWFMKHALRDFLPTEILRKTKHGFGMPFGIWTKEHPGLKEFARGNLEHLKTRKLLRDDYIDELIRLHQEDHATYYGVMIWVLLMLEQWFQRQESIAIP